MSMMSELFDYSDFMPHGYCFLWFPELIWLHIISDLVIAFAYFSIPAFLYYILYKNQKTIHHKWLFVLFSSFILLCGFTHIMDIVTLWYPIYWAQGFLKALTAAVSLATAVSLAVILPNLIKMDK